MTNNFSKNLKVLREASGMKLREVYEKTGITDRTFNYYEHGKTEPGLTNLLKIAKLFNVSVQDLIFGDYTFK